jgi:hypothetical protein
MGFFGVIKSEIKSLPLETVTAIQRRCESEAAMPTCVYCGFSGLAEFPREHVIPRSFGSFQNNLTLGCVCGECNRYFGKHLESWFASESVESIVRFRYGLRDTESAERTRTIRAKANVEGPILGARVLLRPDASAKSGIDNVYVPQVAIKNTNEAEPRWYTLQELNSDVVRTVEAGAGISLFVTSPEEEQALRSRLRELGLGPTQQISRDKVLPRKDFKTRVTCDFDFNMSRCVAKIAFNYLAYVFEENTMLLLRPEFDTVRKYVRDGAPSEQPVVYFSKTPKFEQDSGKPPFVDGHVLAVGWDITNEKVVCALSLFNAMTYHVVLCRKYEGLWFALQNAHTFDFETGEVRSVPVNLLTTPIL